MAKEIGLLRSRDMSVKDRGKQFNMASTGYLAGDIRRIAMACDS
jgi:hypothetical protein